MDSTSIVPFNLYADEYVVWIEKFKNTSSKFYLKIFTWTLGVMGGIGTIFIVLAIIFKGRYILLNVAAFFGACALFSFSILIFALRRQHKKSPQTSYFVTNFRLIELIADKNMYFKVGYLKNLVYVDIDTNSKIPTFVEFEWDEKTDKEAAPAGFYDIDNCREIYDIIKKQQKELKGTEYKFDFIAQ